MTYEFRDPPAVVKQPRKPGKWAQIRALCEERPGEWLYVGVFRAHGALWNPAKGQGLECTGRKRPDGKIDGYVRFIGGAS